MRIQQHAALEQGCRIGIEKLADGREASALGAFVFGTRLTLRVLVPRRLGAVGVVLRLAADGEDPADTPLSYLERRGDGDVYEAVLDTAALCGTRPCGLFYYEYLFLRGWDTLFSTTENNVDAQLSAQSGTRFRLLVFERGYRTPEWFFGGTMYHVFLDRFCRGEGPVSLHGDAQLDPDWEGGVPQYPAVPGDHLSNNVFFGGNLWGLIEKLDYLRSLGVTVLYLSPVFEAYSNHRYDTGDYERIDSILGGEEAFDGLIREAHARGMRVILDGVFNHTGDDSRYFNRRGTYPTSGAYGDPRSPYAEWFSFRSFPDDYECWWNIEILPRLQHQSLACRHYFTGPNGICKRWLLRGADGWRLDVADELSDDFLDELRAVVKQTTGGDGLIIGEVWENAADKVAYGRRRRYFSGRQLDSVMNYPFRNAVLSLLEERDAVRFYNVMTELYGSYPPFVCHSLMNLLGTHDTERILTRLGDASCGEGKSNAALSRLRLGEDARRDAIRKLKLASALQFTVFGVPSVYYGDEVGLEGYHDPFCRMPFPWGREDADLLSHYRALGRLRRRSPALVNGDFRFLEHTASAFAFERASHDQRLLVLANVGPFAWEPSCVPPGWQNALTGTPVVNPLVPSFGFLILEPLQS